MAKNKSQKPAALNDEPAGTPVLDDETDDASLATTSEGGAVASDDDVQPEATAPEATPPSAYDPEPEDTDEELPPVLSRSARKAGKQLYKVWKHGKLELDGKVYEPGSFVELTPEQAESIPCVEAHEPDADA